jgi:hypothetical protein
MTAVALQPAIHDQNYIGEQTENPGANLQRCRRRSTLGMIEQF